MRIATALLVLSFCAATACAQAPANFLTQWAEAKKAAAKEKKPIYIHFASSTCAECKKIERETYADEGVKKALADYVCVSLDCTTLPGAPMPPNVQVNLSLMDRLGGSACHYLVMVTADGIKLNAVEKNLPPKELVKEFALAKVVYKEYLAFRAYAGDPKTDKKSYEFALKSLIFYWEVQNEEHALAAAEMVLQRDPDNDKGDHVLAKTAQLEFSHDTPDKTLGLMDEVCKLDPQNAKGAFEKAILMQIRFEYREYLINKAAPSDAKPHLAAAIKLVEKAQVNEAKLKEPGKFYKLGAQACVFLEQYDKSIEWAQRALAVSKSAGESKSLKAIIEQIKAAKAASESTSQPAKE
jgi:tetratricopeptide (TPR) repeat protein